MSGTGGLDHPVYIFWCKLILEKYCKIQEKWNFHSNKTRRKSMECNVAWKTISNFYLWPRAAFQPQPGMTREVCSRHCHCAPLRLKLISAHPNEGKSNRKQREHFQKNKQTNKSRRMKKTGRRKIPESINLFGSLLAPAFPFRVSQLSLNWIARECLRLIFPA